MYLNISPGKPSPIPLPCRIVSLVPSISELLWDLGLDKEVTGITKFCVHPENWFRTKPRTGGTKNVNIELLRKLNPDLVLANKEENVREEIDAIAAEFPVWVSDISNLDEALLMIQSIGIVTRKENEALNMTTRILKRFGSIEKISPGLRACYLIWKDPLMTVGGDTFINDMMQRVGLLNVFSDMIRYPELTIEQVIERGCDIILLSSEPYPFNEKHVSEMRSVFPGKIILVDGEMFSWYGSHLLKAPAYFRGLISSMGEDLPA
jgi:ABC-type Fe3+-hydroxamate transport system substrate-binding protein